MMTREVYGLTGRTLSHSCTMDQTSVTAAGAIDTFLLVLICIGPKLALVPFLEITASLDPATKQRVQRKMLTTAAVAVVLMVLGELLRTLFHFTLVSLSIAGGLILLVLAAWMLAPPDGSRDRADGKDPMQLAQFPLAVRAREAGLALAALGPIARKRMRIYHQLVKLSPRISMVMAVHGTGRESGGRHAASHELCPGQGQRWTSGNSGDIHHCRYAAHRLAVL